MSDDSSYDDVVSRQPGGRLTKKDIQRARYGSQLDERRHEFRRSILRWAKVVGALTTIAGAVATALKTFNIHF